MRPRRGRTRRPSASTRTGSPTRSSASTAGSTRRARDGVQRDAAGQDQTGRHRVPRLGDRRRRGADRLGRPLVDGGDRAPPDSCYLTTTGRTSGNPHTIEIWFALHGDRVYLLAGGGDQ